MLNRDAKYLSPMSRMWIIDESKTHIFLSPFFKNIFGLKVQFNTELWRFHLNFLFWRNINEINRIQQKKE